MSMWILTMLIHPAKDFCTHPSPRKLHRERRSSKGTFRETTLTNMEKRREFITEPLPCSLPHKSQTREWAPIVSLALPAVSFPRVWMLPHAWATMTLWDLKGKRGQGYDPVLLLSPGGLRKCSDVAGVSVNCSVGHEPIGNFPPPWPWVDSFTGET